MTGSSIRYRATEVCRLINGMMMIEEVLFKFVKFGLVGFSGLIIDFGITYLLKERFKVRKLVANSCGFIIAASSNYMLNRMWTFHSENENISSEFTLFLTFSLVGLVINNGILYFFNEKLKVNFYLAKLIAIGLTVIWNFSSNYLFNF